MTSRIPDRAPLTTDTTSTTSTTSTSPITTSPSSVRAGPIPTIEITRRDPIPMDNATAHAAQPLLHPARASHHVPNAMSMHAVESTPAPKSAAELFKNKVASENLRHKGDSEAADQKMKDYERDVSNLTIKRVALAIITPILLVALVASVFALASLIPPIGAGVGAGLVIGLTMGLAYGGTGLACAIITGAILLDPDDPDEPEMPQKEREQLEKNLKNTNKALELFEKYPLDATKPNTSYMEFLDTLPALTTDGVRSYELDQLDKYNNLFSKKLELQKLNDAPKLIGEVQKAEKKLRDLGVADPTDASSIQNRIDELTSPIQITSGLDDELEMENLDRNENEEKINSIRELSGRLVELRQKSKDAVDFSINNSKESLENEFNTDKETLAKAIAEKQKQIDQGQPDREIEALNKELRTTKEAYFNQLRSSNIPEGELSARMQQKEQSLQEVTTEIHGLEEKINALINGNSQLQRTPARTKADINANITHLDKVYKDITQKLADNGVSDPLAKNAIKDRIAELKEIKERGFEELEAMKAEIAKLKPDDASLKEKNAKLADMQEQFDMHDKDDYENYIKAGKTTNQILALEELAKYPLDELKKEKKFETDTLEIINLNAKIAGLTAVQTRLESEISELKSVIANKNKIVEIERKILAVKNKKQIQDLNTKSEQLETKLKELKGKADADQKNHYQGGETRFDTNARTKTYARINTLKDEIQALKDEIKKGNVGAASEALKQLEIKMNVLADEAAYRTEVHTRFAAFKENYAKLSPTDKEKRISEGKDTEEYKYYEVELNKYLKLIEEEEERLKNPEYKALQDSRGDDFAEHQRLRNLKQIVYTAKNRYFEDLEKASGAETDRAL